MRSVGWSGGEGPAARHRAEIPRRSAARSAPPGPSAAGEAVPADGGRSEPEAGQRRREGRVGDLVAESVLGGPALPWPARPPGSRRCPVVPLRCRPRAPCGGGSGRGAPAGGQRCRHPRPAAFPCAFQLVGTGGLFLPPPPHSFCFLHMWSQITPCLTQQSCLSHSRFSGYLVKHLF